MFRNLSFFRFHPTLDAFIRQELDERAAECALKPVGPLELSSRGWVQYAPDTDGDRLPYVLSDDVVLLTLGGEDKVLPASAVNRELAARLKDLEEREGRKPGGRARKRLREDVVHDLLPRALVKPYRLDGYLDLRRGLVVVDTASRKAAEEWVGKLRETLGSFPALPLLLDTSQVRRRLTEWMAGAVSGEWGLPLGWSLGDECELRAPGDGGAVARLSNQELLADEVQEHFDTKLCTRLGLYLGDRLSFTLGEDLVVRKLRFLDGCMDQLEAEERDDLQAELDARATLLVGEVGRLFDTLEQAFKLSKVEG